MSSLRIRTPAKINLFLRVVRRRDDGYHELETIFQTVDLWDELIVRKTSASRSLEVPGRPDLEGPDNLVMRALRVLEAEVQSPLPVKMLLRKNIPTAGGLGGGSSDAAAALTAIKTLFNLKLDAEAMNRIALSLGADVPFFLVGGSAVGEGVGERLTPIDLPVDYDLVLVNPGFPVSTARIFGEFSRTLTPRREEDTVWGLLREQKGIEALMRNDLQAVTERLHPEVGEMRRSLERLGAKKALMTGSGPTVFAIGSRDRLDGIRRSLPAQWQSFGVRPLREGMVIC